MEQITVCDSIFHLLIIYFSATVVGILLFYTYFTLSVEIGGQLTGADSLYHMGSGEQNLLSGFTANVLFYCSILLAPAFCVSSTVSIPQSAMSCSFLILCVHNT